MNTDRCKHIVAAIQNLQSTEQMELFRMLHTHKCEYTRNNNGIFINLSWLPDDLLDKIEQYIAFCTKSHYEVRKYESICDVLNRNIHERAAQAEQRHHEHPEKFDVPAAMQYANAGGDKRPCSYSKVSSSMRFYLLKKKFAKQTPLVTTAKTDLSREPYVM